MTHPFVLIGLWVVLAFILAAIPSTDNHWRRAYVLIAAGVPLVVWIAWHNGIAMAAIAVLVGGLVLRWPVYFLWARLKQLFGGS
ncbi:DUF2484 family protein [Yoonia sp.]|uniref:DUF2484 family protein n=1 Tax=Yoonia sp. TaxID=2212373 RepID=UPI00358F112C